MVKVCVAFPTVNCPEHYTTVLFKFKGKINSINYDNLIFKLCDHTKTKRGKFFISWHDGTEYCTISTSESLREAIFNMQCNREDKTPLIFASPIPIPGKTQAPAFYGGCEYVSLPTDFRERALSKTQPNNEEDYGDVEQSINIDLICNVCQKEDWNGDRFTCVVCPRLVLCPKCFELGAHNEHPVLITRENTVFPCPVLKAVKIAALNVGVEDSDGESNPESPSYNYDQNMYHTITTNNTSTNSSVASSNNNDLTIYIDNTTNNNNNNNGANLNTINIFSDRLSGEFEVQEILSKLREMGFTQNTNDLVNLVRKEHCNIQSVVEKLADE